MNKEFVLKMKELLSVENTQFEAVWMPLNDELFKIKHSMMDLIPLEVDQLVKQLLTTGCLSILREDSQDFTDLMATLLNRLNSEHADKDFLIKNQGVFFSVRWNGFADNQEAIKFIDRATFLLASRKVAELKSLLENLNQE